MFVFIFACLIHESEMFIVSPYVKRRQFNRTDVSNDLKLFFDYWYFFNLSIHGTKDWLLPQKDGNTIKKVGFFSQKTIMLFQFLTFNNPSYQFRV